MKSRRLNIRAISSEIKVSTATISRVLNNRPDVSPRTRQRVLSYLKKIGYHPRTLDDSLHLIGLVDTFSRHTLSSYYLSSIADSFDRRVRSYGYNTMLLPSDQILRELHTHAHASILKRLDGILWMEPIFSKRFARILAEHKVPCVVINNCEDDVDIDVVESDNRSASRQAVEFLLDKGHTAIGFVGGWLHLTNHKDRFDAYKERMAEAGISIRDDWIIDDITLWNDEGGNEGIHRLLGRSNRPSAVVLCSDYLAVGAYRAVRELGFSIPTDVSIVSFDDFPLAPYLDPPLTTFRQPLQEMGEIAATKLIGLITGERTPQSRHYLRCPLIVRKSAQTFQRAQGAGREEPKTQK
ncbi:MAG: LacI family DNA-binding transcriptional regulator [Spirochaetia bacterium]|jgi:LacI family transcriptional regulator